MNADLETEPKPPLNTSPELERVESCLPSRPGLYLDVSRAHHFWDEAKGEYVRKIDADVGNAPSEIAATGNEEEKHAFTIRRYFNPMQPGEAGIMTSIESRSPYFLEAASVVMKEVRGRVWNDAPFEITLELILGHLDRFQDYCDDLNRKDVRTNQESLVLEHLSFFLRFFCAEFSAKITLMTSLINQGMISYDLLPLLFVPGEIIYAVETLNKHPSAMRYAYYTDNTDSISITGEYLQRVDHDIGYAEYAISIPRFEGLKRIDSFDVFPMKYHPQAQEITQLLVERGRKAYKLGGIHHVHYSGIAYPTVGNPGSKPVQVDGRIILDKTSFYVYSGESGPKSISRDLNGKDFIKSQAPKPIEVPSDEALMVTAAYLYGFDLTTKLWYFFNVSDISDIRWNNTAFTHLALPADHKELVESLVASHKQGNGLNGDFVEDKGSGLILSLFGPPGVGKTLTAEATSELMRCPLYFISAGELGSTAADVEANLRRIFRTAALWNAVLLIDEADVFLEQRTRTNLTRNAIVAVMLRELEYFPGIMILTTNRMVIFDEALESRIHISLHYPELGPQAKESIWRTFLSKAGVVVPAGNSILQKLVKMNLNGRQIKNIVNTANLFAQSQKRQLDGQQTWEVARLTQDTFLVDNRPGEEMWLWGSIVIMVCILLCLGVEQLLLGTSFLNYWLDNLNVEAHNLSMTE